MARFNPPWCLSMAHTMRRRPKQFRRTPKRLEDADRRERNRASGMHDRRRRRNIPAFENIETGVLERDLATHEAAALEETDEGEVLIWDGWKVCPARLHRCIT